STLASALFNAARSGDHDVLTGAYCRTVTRVVSFTGAEVVEGLRKAIPLADTAKSRAQFTAALGTLGSPEALAFSKELAGSSDAAMAELMKPVLEKVTKQNEQAKALSSGDNLLDSSTAVVVSDTDDASYNKEMHYLTGWRSPQSRFAWDILVSSPVTMEVEVHQSSVIKDHTFHLTIGHTSVEKDVTVTRTTDAFVPVKAGKFTLTKPGSWRVWLEPGRMSENQALMNIRKITLKVE
ncbi:MAG TPA: hypothetical protein VHM91_12975, partial [Verrucomicrobiales bacterium]|nr:hypothetical protein [Verrucomicrobiales bacterium]